MLKRNVLQISKVEILQLIKGNILGETSLLLLNDYKLDIVIKYDNINNFSYDFYNTLKITNENFDNFVSKYAKTTDGTSFIVHYKFKDFLKLINNEYNVQILNEPLIDKNYFYFFI